MTVAPRAPGRRTQNLPQTLTPPYDLHFVSEAGGKVKTSAGVTLETEPFTDMPFDTLVIGGANFPEPSTPRMLAFMKDAPKRHRRIAALCTGAFVLAEAGLIRR